MLCEFHWLFTSQAGLFSLSRDHGTRSVSSFHEKKNCIAEKVISEEIKTDARPQEPVAERHPRASYLGFNPAARLSIRPNARVLVIVHTVMNTLVGPIARAFPSACFGV